MNSLFGTPNRSFKQGYTFDTPIRYGAQYASWSPSPERQSPLFDSIPSTSKTPSRLPLNASLGYFALSGTQPESPASPLHEERVVKEEEERDQTEEHETYDSSARKARLEKESIEATQGEFEWVRSGGVLRDARGRRDQVRTEAIRAEIRIQAEESEVMRKWKVYDERWKSLARSVGPIRFHDIPWPREEDTATLEDLDPNAMRKFILSPLEVRANKATRKELVRASWLRWHPDKLGSILARIVPEDEEFVREGISIVMICLKELQGG